MRIGALIGLRCGIAMQSYGWSMLRPLGNLQSVLSALDEYECDEVGILRITRGNRDISNFSKDINVLKACKSSTPLSFGGGIRTIDDLRKISSLPIERVIFSSQVLNGQTDLVKAASDTFGKQAIQFLLPVKLSNDQIYMYDCQKKSYILLNPSIVEYIQSEGNEVIIHDTLNEGHEDMFNLELIEKITIPNKKLMISGGTGPETIKTASRLGVACTLIDNRTLHSEQTIKKIKYDAKL